MPVPMSVGTGEIAFKSSIDPIFLDVRGPMMVVARGGRGEQDDDHCCDDAPLALDGENGGDWDLLVIDGCNQEEWHCHINPVFPDKKGLEMVVVGTMPPYNDCRHHDKGNNDGNNNDRLAWYLATGAAPPPPTLLLLSSLSSIGKKNWGKKRDD